MSAEHSSEVKAAVMAALLQGQSVHEVAKEYSVPRSTVTRWKKEGGRSVGPQKREIGDLIVEYLRENLETLRSQAVTFRNPKWLERQSAENAAVLHGVMTDKAIRLLEALGRAEDEADKAAQA